MLNSPHALTFFRLMDRFPYKLKEYLNVVGNYKYMILIDHIELKTQKFAKNKYDVFDR